MMVVRTQEDFFWGGNSEGTALWMSAGSGKFLCRPGLCVCGVVAPAGVSGTHHVLAVDKDRLYVTWAEKRGRHLPPRLR